MIVGLGIDLCSIARMQALLDRWGERFSDRILVTAERELLALRADRAALVAGRYAVKEAFAKATAGAPGVGWHDVEVVGGGKRAPTMKLHGRAAELARRLGADRTYISISHDGGLAVGLVVLERCEGVTSPGV